MNIAKHVLMPKLEILSAQEKRKLVNKYKLEDKQVRFHYFDIYHQPSLLLCLTN